MSKRDFIIPFIGLKIGFHTFEFDIEDSFFEDIEYSIIHHGKVHVKLELEKKETMLIGNFIIEGTVNTSCDRCNDPIDVEIDGEYQLIFKLGGENTNDEVLIVLDQDAYEIDVKMNIYELITISLPIKIVHEAGECNPEMLALLDQYVINANDDDDEYFDDDEDFDDEFEDDDYDDDEEDSDDESGDENDDNDDIDPRWSILKNLN